MREISVIKSPELIRLDMVYDEMLVPEERAQALAELSTKYEIEEVEEELVQRLVKPKNDVLRGEAVKRLLTNFHHSSKVQNYLRLAIDKLHADPS